MPRYFAFLRAINVGGHTVKMDHLRRLFAALGFANVETFIASGNVIFDARARDAAALEQRIEKHLGAELGYAVATFIRAPADLAAIAAYQAFPAAALTGPRPGVHVAFLKAPPARAARAKLLASETEVDTFHVHGREVYWLARAGLGQSQFSGGLLEKILGQPATLRNTTSLRKLAAKYAPSP
jgi:uncharacterized protein (DUF1697 family)